MMRPVVVKEGPASVRVSVRPFGPFFGVFVDDSGEPLSVGRTERLACLRAMDVLRCKLRDIREVVRGEGRCGLLLSRLSRTLAALEELEGGL